MPSGVTKYYITPNFIDLSSLHYGEDWNYDYKFLLYDNTKENYQPIIDMNLTNGTLYLAVKINRTSDNTNHFIIFDFFACVDLDSYVEMSGGVENNEFSYVQMSFTPDVHEADINLLMEITVFKELCILNELQLKLQSEYPSVSFDRNSGSWQGIYLSYADIHRRIFEFCKDNFGAVYSVFPNLIDSSGVPSTSCDLSQVLTALSNMGDGLHSHLSGVQDGINVNIQGIQSNINGLQSSFNGSFSGIHQHLDDVSSQLTTELFSFQSLNGNCGSFKDNSFVNVVSKTGDYTVKNSQFVYDDVTKKSSMIIYQLEKDGNFIIVPDIYVSKSLTVLGG